MTVTKLRPGTSTVCPPTPMEIDWQVTGGPTAAVSVGIELCSTPGGAATAVQPIDARRMLLTGLPEAVALVARPRHDATIFADGVRFEAQVSLRNGPDDSDQVVLPSVDVSGTASGVLFTIAPVPAGWKITAARSGRSVSGTADWRTPTSAAIPAATSMSVLPPTAVTVPNSGAVADATLPAAGTDVPLVQRAVYAARRLCGAPSLPPDRISTFVLAVDRSASMLAHQRSGALHSILELLVGVSAVCGASRPIAVWGMGPRPNRIFPDLGSASLGEYVRTTLGEQALTSGTALASLVATVPAATARQTVFVITDDVPPDLTATVAALRARPDPPGAMSWHLLVLGRDSADSRVRAEPWRDELRVLAPLVDQGLFTMSAIAPDERPDWLADQLSTSDRLDAVVGGFGVWRETT